MAGAGSPAYAFVHAVISRSAISAGGKYCGVDMITNSGGTGCYVDMTLPSAPDESQIPLCSIKLRMRFAARRKMPHRRGTESVRREKSP
jgi:hypothetical protein